MNAKQECMQTVMETGFVVLDLNLYLDTHPTCEHGLAAYQQAKAAYLSAVSAYTLAYGPLTACHIEPGSVWAWDCAPWPWELEE